MNLGAGDVLGGRFRLDRLLGEGGMGMVWRAEDLTKGGFVALKFLRGQRVTEVAHKRFFREARAAMAVKHPNVVRVHEVLTAPDGAPLMVMDYLAGESLGERLERKKKLTVAEAAELLLPVVSAIGTANAKGIVHRDLKPDNIFIVDDGGRDDVRVLDFGIAKLTAQDGDAMATANLTGTNAMLGTPYYMSPEQVLSDKTIDHRSDVWSIGVILYECLSGQRPLGGDSIGALLVSITTGKMTPLRELQPDLPADVLDLVDRMLSIDRDRRPSDLREVFDVLAQYGPASRRPAFFGEATMDAQIALDETSPGEPLSLTSTNDAVVRAVAPPARSPFAWWAVAGVVAIGGLAAGGFALRNKGTATAAPPSDVTTSAPTASAVTIVPSAAPSNATSAPSVAPSAVATQADAGPARPKPKPSGSAPAASASVAPAASASGIGSKAFLGNPYGP